MCNDSGEKLSLGQISAFALPAAGLAALLFFVQFFFLKYGTEVLLIPPVLVGAMLAGAKIWDAVTDPLIGSISDHSNSSRGRRHPWMWWSLPVIGIGFLAIWAVPLDFSLWKKVTLSLLALLVFYTGYTLHSVPHVSFGAEFTTNSHQRVRAFGARHILWTIGLLVSFVFVQLSSGKPQSNVLTLTLGLVIGALILCAITPAFLKPRPAQEKCSSSNFVYDYKSVLTEPGALILFLVWFIENLGTGVMGALTPFYADYVLDRPDLIGALPAVYVLAGVISIPLWVPLSRVLGKKQTWILAMVVGAFSFALTYASSVSLSFMFIALGLAGTSMACGGVMSLAVMADLIDRLEARTGVRREGTFTALLNLGLKTGIAMSTALGGVMLGLVGFQANQVQSPQTVEGIRVFFAAFPTLGFLVGIALFVRFPAAEN